MLSFAIFHYFYTEWFSSPPHLKIRLIIKVCVYVAKFSDYLKYILICVWWKLLFVYPSGRWVEVMGAIPRFPMQSSSCVSSLSMSMCIVIFTLQTLTNQIRTKFKKMDNGKIMSPWFFKFFWFVFYFNFFFFWSGETFCYSSLSFTPTTMLCRANWFFFPL